MSSSHKVPASIVASCSLAGCLEIYDFVIFGFLSKILHRNYFVFLDADSALLIAYILFAVGFVVRPAGALIFGHIGDRYGRKAALVTSVFLMGSASLGMFLLPDYGTIGISACYMIVLIRIIQGLSVGGEYSGAIIYALEHCDRRKSGIAGSLVVSGCMAGVLLATFVSSVLELPAIPEYGWRFAFLLGFLLSVIGFFIRKKLGETPEFLKIRKTLRLPLLTGFREYKTESLTALLMAATNGTNLYYVSVYLPVYLKSRTELDLWYLPIITTLAIALCSPFFGWLSDHYDRARMVAAGTLGLSLYSLIMLPLILCFPCGTGICLVIAGHALIYSVQAGTMNTHIVEIFPPKYRYSCSAFFYSIGMGIIGGTSPAVASLIARSFENPDYIPGFYMGGISFLGFIAVKMTVGRDNSDKFENYQKKYESVTHAGNG